MFEGRPSASPVIAGLFLAGVIRKSYAVLDLGCGDGTDCFALAAWGVRRVDGIEWESDAYERAERRLAAFRAHHGGNAFGLNRITFHLGSVTSFHDCLDDAQFDVVVDTLLWNNIATTMPHATPGYVRQAARVLRPGGLLVLHVREDLHPFDVMPAREDLPSSFHKFFAMTDGLSTDLAEFEDGAPAHAGVAVYLGRRRSRPRTRRQP